MRAVVVDRAAAHRAVASSLALGGIRRGVAGRCCVVGRWSHRAEVRFRIAAAYGTGVTRVLRTPGATCTRSGLGVCRVLVW